MTADTLYSAADAADLFGLTEARLRYWAQTGFISPSARRKGRFFYTFQDLLALKVAKELLERGLPVQRVRKNLEALRARLPTVERPLTQLRICSDGDDLLVVDDGVAFQPKTGQLVMSFAVAALEERLLTLHAAEPTPPTAYGCFLAGLAADDRGDHARAQLLYQRAVELDPSFAAAWTNLGNQHERAGRRADGKAAYERALDLDPDQPEARYNLANLHADAGDDELAVAEYRRALAARPEFADARHNLALVQQRLR